MRLFAFDVDGTIVSNYTTFHVNTIKALNRILENGDAVVIASGRPFVGIKYFLNKLKPGHKFAIAANGAATYDYNGNVIDMCCLQFKDYVDFYEKFKWTIKERDASIYCYTLKEVGYFKLTLNTFTESSLNNWVPLRNMKRKPLKDEDPILKFLIAIHRNKMEGLDFSEETKKFHFVDSSEYYHEFVHNDSDKARGVEALRQLLKINKEDVYCFGDEMNDFLMIKNYHGVAMGNARDEVKAVAKDITLTDIEFGVADYINKFYDNLN